MYLFSLILLFALAGYVLATTRFNRRVDSATERVSASITRITQATRDRWQALFGPTKGDEFRIWALGIGAPLFPDDFKTWLAGMSPQEALQFQQSLIEYSDSLGFRLIELVDGSLDHDPIMRQVFVEAIVVYSPAYRRARQAQKKGEAESKAIPGDGDKRPAEKAASRRKGTDNGHSVAESGETASAA